MKKMLKKTMTFLFVGALLALLASVAMAAESDTDTQLLTLDVSEIAVLDATASTPTTIALTVTAPTTGGAPVEVTDANATSYAQYTSVVVSGQTRTISAALDADKIPAGLKLNLAATGVSGNEGTVVGAGVDFIATDYDGGDIITAIGSCETGTDPTDGAQLTYTLSVTDISSVLKTASQVSMTVTLTLTEGAA